MAKKNDIANKSIEELKKEVSEIRVSINKTGLEMKMRKIKDTNAVKKLRKTLAQLLTVLKFKELTNIK